MDVDVGGTVNIVGNASGVEGLTKGVKAVVANFDLNNEDLFKKNR